MEPARLSTESVARLLGDRYELVTDVELLKGGMWSTAFRFDSAGRPLVVRFGHHIEDYEKDRMAVRWSRPGLPIPDVLEIGTAFDGVFAVSERMHGDKIDELAPDRIGVAIDHLIDGLVELQEVAVPGTGFGMWAAQAGDAPHATWGGFLTSVPDEDSARVDGWRPAMAASPGELDVFDRAQSKLEELVVDCPDKRQVVHGDLLAGNVLVSPENRISAMFDWGNSLAGDPLYDLAWLMFWSPWHPGIDPERVRRAAARFDDDGTGAIDSRLRCYQLHVALQGMQYQAFAGLDTDLQATAQHTERALLQP